MGSEDDKPEPESPDGEVIGSAALRPVFLGNLKSSYAPEAVTEIFEKPIVPSSVAEGTYGSIPVDRIDLKRGYCFVFLKDATSQSDKEQVERFISDINGMKVPNVSTGLRAEFARGDGRVKKKEDERRKNIAPSETLFVVNFNEDTTKRQDLQMLFEPFGELVRIDMKRNYAFVQFKNIEQATKAKETTNGGKLDQSVLTVEYVARQRGDSSSRDRDRRRDRGRDRYDDRRGPPPPPPPMRGPPPPYDRRYRDEPRHYDDFRRHRDRSPPRGRPRSRSRSRSPPPRYGHRSRSPARRYDDRYDDYRRSSGSPPDYRDMRRGGSPDREYYRGDRERGYRP